MRLDDFNVSSIKTATKLFSSVSRNKHLFYRYLCYSQKKIAKYKTFKTDSLYLGIFFVCS